MIESMCVICHGPVPKKRNARTSIYCGLNRHGMWRRYKHGATLPPRYLQIRAVHACRREMERAQASIERHLGRGGWLAVG